MESGLYTVVCAEVHNRALDVKKLCKVVCPMRNSLPRLFLRLSSWMILFRLGKTASEYLFVQRTKAERLVGWVVQALLCR